MKSSTPTPDLTSTEKRSAVSTFRALTVSDWQAIKNQVATRVVATITASTNNRTVTLSRRQVEYLVAKYEGAAPVLVHDVDGNVYDSNALSREQAVEIAAGWLA